MTVLASGADERYGYWLLNMVGSVKANSDLFERIVLYDLGLSPFQRRLVDGIRGVDVRRVPPFVPHWRRGRTWKAWIWTHVEADELLWLDAGLTVLRPLTAVVDAIRRDGYFLVSQGVANRSSIPSDYAASYGLSEEQLDRAQVAAGIIGFQRSGRFYRDVIEPTYDDCVRGLSLGVSAGEAAKYDVGLDRDATPILRDCPLFRHEQTLLNVHVVRELVDPTVHDLDRFAGWRSARDHPEQVIWSHRRRGDFRHLASVPYRPLWWLPGKLWGVAFRRRWWMRNHSWLFRPATYVSKAKRIPGGLPPR